MPLAAEGRIHWTLAAIAAAVCMAGCAAPLGPGFRIEEQLLHAEYVAAPQPAVIVRAAWHVRNTGNQPLEGVDVLLPDPSSQNRDGLTAEVNGSALQLSSGNGRSTRLAFDPPLGIEEARDIVLSYELRGAKDAASGTDVTEQGFVLPPGDWAPALLRPKRALARGGEPPKKWEMTIRVPSGWRVHASGRPKGKDHGEDARPATVTYRFEQRKDGFLPFAVAGAFQEAKVSAGGNDVLLWTRQPLPANLARQYAEQIVGAVQFYDGAFGPRKIAARRWWMIECPRKDPCWAVPQAALVSGDPLREDSSRSIGAQLERQLAFTWLEFRVRPDWNKEPLPLGALTDYAADLAGAAQERGDSRRIRIHALLAFYDLDKAREPEPPVFSVRLSDPASARQFAGVKSELFWFALEDAAGTENLLRALRHLLKAYPGGNWRADDLRSALEQECGKNLAPLFRRWLVEPGIPEDFRGRYP